MARLRDMFQHAGTGQCFRQFSRMVMKQRRGLEIETLGHRRIIEEGDATAVANFEEEMTIGIFLAGDGILKDEMLFRNQRKFENILVEVSRFFNVSTIECMVVQAFHLVLVAPGARLRKCVGPQNRVRDGGENVLHVRHSMTSRCINCGCINLRRDRLYDANRRCGREHARQSQRGFRQQVGVLLGRAFLATGGRQHL